MIENRINDEEQRHLKLSRYRAVIADPCKPLPMRSRFGAASSALTREHGISA
jgi:hypothetical protein